MSKHTLIHCPLCGRVAVMCCEGGKEIEGCPVCFWRNYDNPTPVSSTFVTYLHYVALVKRIDGSWCLPVGYVDRDESPSEAAERETLQESSLTVKVPEVPMRIFTIRGENQHIMVFRAIRWSGVIAHADDAEGAGWFDPRHLPRMSFQSDVEVIREWYASRTIWHAIRERIARWIAPHLFRYSA